MTNTMIQHLAFAPITMLVMLAGACDDQGEYDSTQGDLTYCPGDDADEADAASSPAVASGPTSTTDPAFVDVFDNGDTVTFVAMDAVGRADGTLILQRTPGAMGRPIYATGYFDISGFVSGSANSEVVDAEIKRRAAHLAHLIHHPLLSQAGWIGCAVRITAVLAACSMTGPAFIAACPMSMVPATCKCLEAAGLETDPDICDF